MTCKFNTKSTFHFDFIGREVTAIGIVYPCNKEVCAQTYDEAVNKLYETHDHIRITNWTQWQNGQQVDGTYYRKK